MFKLDRLDDSCFVVIFWVLTPPFNWSQATVVFVVIFLVLDPSSHWNGATINPIRGRTLQIQILFIHKTRM